MASTTPNSTVSSAKALKVSPRPKQSETNLADGSAFMRTLCVVQLSVGYFVQTFSVRNSFECASSIQTHDCSFLSSPFTL